MRLCLLGCWLAGCFAVVTPVSQRLTEAPAAPVGSAALPSHAAEKPRPSGVSLRKEGVTRKAAATIKVQAPAGLPSVVAKAQCGMECSKALWRALEAKAALIKADRSSARLESTADEVEYPEWCITELCRSEFLKSVSDPEGDSDESPKDSPTAQAGASASKVGSSGETQASGASQASQASGASQAPQASGAPPPPLVSTTTTGDAQQSSQGPQSSQDPQQAQASDVSPGGRERGNGIVHDYGTKVQSFPVEKLNETEALAPKEYQQPQQINITISWDTIYGVGNATNASNVSVHPSASQATAAAPADLGDGTLPHEQSREAEAGSAAAIPSNRSDAEAMAAAAAASASEGGEQGLANASGLSVSEAPPPVTASPPPPAASSPQTSTLSISTLPSSRAKPSEPLNSIVEPAANVSDLLGVQDRADLEAKLREGNITADEQRRIAAEVAARNRAAAAAAERADTEEQDGEMDQQQGTQDGQASTARKERRAAAKEAAAKEAAAAANGAAAAAKEAANKAAAADAKQQEQQQKAQQQQQQGTATQQAQRQSSQQAERQADRQAERQTERLAARAEVERARERRVEEPVSSREVDHAPLDSERGVAVPGATGPSERELRATTEWERLRAQADRIDAEAKSELAPAAEAARMSAKLRKQAEEAEAAEAAAKSNSTAASVASAAAAAATTANATVAATATTANTTDLLSATPTKEQQQAADALATGAKVDCVPGRCWLVSGERHDLESAVAAAAAAHDDGHEK